MKLSDYVIAFVAGQGVKHVFMLPGGGAMHLVDSLGRCADLTYVANLHEQACAVAAEAYARVTNNLGVAVVTTGPGGTNTVTGVAGAWLDSTPCLFISGQVKRSDMKKDSGLRQLGVQEIDIVTLVSSITKYAVTVTDPSTIRYHLEKAVWLAKSGRKGPVWIDIPLDVQAAEIAPDGLAGFAPGETGAIGDCHEVAEKVAGAIALLNRAERPVILAGNGIRSAGAQETFLEVIDRLGVPVLTTRLGVDLLPESHPLCAGMPGSIAARGANFVLQNADWLLVLGARLDMAFIAYAPHRLARAAKKIMVNIDRTEIDKLGIIDLAVCADAGMFLNELLLQSAKVGSVDRSEWMKRCREWKSRYPFVRPEHRNETAGISVYAFSDVLSDELSGGDIILPGSSGFACEIFLTALRVKAGQRVFHNKGTGAMGFAQPSAIGACLAGGGRRTVCVDGDGGFPMNVQELETARRLALPVKFFVINNGGYASIRSSQQNYFGRLTAADATSGLTLPDIVRVAEAYGVSARRISEPADLRKQVGEVLSLPGPVVCEVVVIPDEPRAPRVASLQKPDGSMVSKPLEDMWPFLEREEFMSNMIIPPVQEDAGR